MIPIVRVRQDLTPAEQGMEFHHTADHTDDVLDHDMLHAAGALVVMDLPTSTYVERFLDGCWEKFVVPLMETDESIRADGYEDWLIEGGQPGE